MLLAIFDVLYTMLVFLGFCCMNCCLVFGLSNVGFTQLLLHELSALSSDSAMLVSLSFCCMNCRPCPPTQRRWFFSVSVAWIVCLVLWLSDCCMNCLPCSLIPLDDWDTGIQWSRVVLFSRKNGSGDTVPCKLFFYFKFYGETFGCIIL